MTDYCECDDSGCEEEHAPLPAGLQAMIDGKLALQKMQVEVEGLAEPLQFAIRTQVWGLVHAAFNYGLDAGRLVERDDVVSFLSDRHLTSLAAHSVSAANAKAIASEEHLS